MMAITHCSIAAAGTSLILGTAAPLPIGLAILGSQLPDIDTTTSTIGKIFFPVSSWIEDRFPHRSITHSLLATVVITIVSLSIGHFLLGDIKAAIALAASRYILIVISLARQSKAPRNIPGKAQGS